MSMTKITSQVQARRKALDKARADLEAKRIIRKRYNPKTPEETKRAEDIKNIPF